MSVTETVRPAGQVNFVGVANFQSVFSNPIFPKAFSNTLHWSVFTALGHLTLGFGLALAMNSALVYPRIRGVCRALILLPWATSPIVVAILIQLWAHPMISPISKILQSLGSTDTFLPLGSPDTAIWTLIGVQVWQFTPFFMLMILAGLQTMDPQLIDAAKVDGASSLQRIRYVTIPHVRGILLTLALFDLVTLSAYFDLIWVATEGGPVRSTEVLATFMYRDAFLSMNWNRAAATGMILLLLLVAVTFLMMKQLQRE